VKIRVCHIITKMELGGAQQNTLYTVSHLNRSRFEPVLMTGSEGLLVEEARDSGVACHLVGSLRREISPARDLAALTGLTRRIRREAPDIVHTHSSKAGILGRWAAWLAGVPHIVHTVHGYGFHAGQPQLARGLLVLVERVTGRATTSATIVVSRANLRAGAELGLFSEDRAFLIRSGIRLADFAPRPFTDEPGGMLTVGMVACLKPQKAPLDFVRVAARVARQLETRPGSPRVQFLIAGDGELRDQVEALIQAEGLSGKVSLLGWRRDMPEVIRTFDIMLHTSRWEGLPRVFPEAMASGVPVVATRVDGAPEAVEEGVTGYLLPAGDIEGLARRVCELARDKELRRAMGAEALRRTAAWDIDQMVRDQEKLYEGLVAGELKRGVALPARLGG